MSNAPDVRESSFFEEEDDSAIASSDPSPTKPALTSQQPLAPKPFPGALGLDSTTSRPTSLEVCPISQPTTTHSGEVVAPLLTSPQKQPLASDQPTIDSALPQFHPDDEVTIKPNGIGRGLYGEVWEVEHKGGSFAAKDYRSGLSEELKEMFMQKMLSLKHKSIVRYFGVCRMKDTNRFVVVMEKFPHSLKSLCQGQGGEKKELQPETKLLILGQVADGLAYLHSHNIIHGDLVPTNILMLTVPEYMAKIADCGNSLVERISTACTKCRLAKPSLLDYLSPETVAGDISKESDVFSFGHLTLYVVLQHEPHPLLKSIEKRKSITRSEVERRRKYFDEMCTNVRGNVLEPLVEWTKLCRIRRIFLWSLNPLCCPSARATSSIEIYRKKEVNNKVRSRT
jgi:serine/threonine protein kinase